MFLLHSATLTRDIPPYGSRYGVIEPALLPSHFDALGAESTRRRSAKDNAGVRDSTMSTGEVNMKIDPLRAQALSSALQSVKERLLKSGGERGAKVCQLTP
jgi:hypothetical protein